MMRLKADFNQNQPGIIGGGAVQYRLKTCAWSEGQGSPQRGEILLGEARVLPQLPVCVVAHPAVILRLPVEVDVNNEK